MYLCVRGPKVSYAPRTHFGTANAFFLKKATHAHHAQHIWQDAPEHKTTPHPAFNPVPSSSMQKRSVHGPAPARRTPTTPGRSTRGPGGTAEPTCTRTRTPAHDHAHTHAHEHRQPARAHRAPQAGRIPTPCICSRNTSADATPPPKARRDDADRRSTLQLADGAYS
jgi:hypothetical protein